MRKLLFWGCLSTIVAIICYVAFFLMLAKIADRTIENSLKPDTTITVTNGNADTTIIIKSKPWYAQ